VDADAADAVGYSEHYALGADMKRWPLNTELVAELERDFAEVGPVDYSDVLTVPPNRSQMRSVLIFAVPEEEGSPA